MTSGISETLPSANPRLIVVQAAQIIVLLVADVVQRPARRLNALPSRRHFVISNFLAARGEKTHRDYRECRRRRHL